MFYYGLGKGSYLASRMIFCCQSQATKQPDTLEAFQIEKGGCFHIVWRNSSHAGRKFSTSNKLTGWYADLQTIRYFFPVFESKGSPDHIYHLGPFNRRPKWIFGLSRTIPENFICHRAFWHAWWWWVLLLVATKKTAYPQQSNMAVERLLRKWIVS